MRIQYPVRTDEAVVAEILVFVYIISVEVTRISVYLLAAAVFPAVGLVYKIPDESSLVCRIFAYDVPILLESSL